MEKGKYPRNGLKGISKLQREILSVLDDINPTTLEDIKERVFSEEKQTWSNKVLLNTSITRLKNRNLIKSLGRNSKAQNLWVKINDN